MLLVHVPKITNRLNYIFDFIFSDVIRISYRFTTDTNEFISSTGPKISYGNSRISDAVFVPSTDLLYREDISRQLIEYGTWNNFPVFFQIKNADVPFDVFAASFFLLSRYEEYLPHSKDSHGRYRPEDSAAFKGSFLDRPIINLWAEELKKVLQKRYPQFIFPFPSFVFTPTIDIDNAYAYKFKGWRRITGSLMEKLITFEFKKFYKRLTVHLGYGQDPYDSYDKQEKIHKSYNIKPLYFILLGDYGKFDKNLSHKNPYMVKLIQRLGASGTVGLHPSYNSNKSERQLEKEKGRLEEILGKKIEKSRQHYIKLSIPQTYRNLQAVGIREDYSMGYPSKIGFRASTCTPFPFFDLEKNQKKELKIYPFVAMDSTLKYYLRFRPKEVVQYLKPIVDEVKSVGGNFVFVFHNESIGDGRNWKSWGNVYEKVVRLSLSEAIVDN